MASFTMMASFVGGVSAGALNRNRTLIVPRAAKAESQAAAKQQTSTVSVADERSGRRAMLLAVAAAAVAAVGPSRATAAEGEPKPGSLEAKKKYASICVTMPTAKVCRN